MTSAIYGKTGSRAADKFVVRLPDGWRDDIQAKAQKLHVSMNTVILYAIEKDLNRSAWLPQVGQAVYYQDSAHIFTITGFSGEREALVVWASCAQRGGVSGPVTDFNPVTI